MYYLKQIYKRIDGNKSSLVVRLATATGRLRTIEVDYLCDFDVLYDSELQAPRFELLEILIENFPKTKIDSDCFI